MAWTRLDFGKHSGKTLPQVLFSDPDWFFWAIEKGVFENRLGLNDEAEILNHLSRTIRIPDRYGGRGEHVAEYAIDRSTKKFAGMELVPKSRPNHVGSSKTFRKKVIDLSVPRKIARYDKAGSKEMISDVKLYLFGDASARMTRKRCEDFFDDNDNFVQ